MKAPKETYQILVNRYALFAFAMDAASPDEACKILNRELRSGELKRARGDQQPIEAFWANPADKGDAWVVQCASRQPSHGEPPIMAWNGAKVVKLNNLSAAGDD